MDSRLEKSCKTNYSVKVEGTGIQHCTKAINSLFGWLVADGWCWFVLREEYCWLVAAGCLWLVRSERKVLLAGG
jgi:hypothetical protein